MEFAATSAPQSSGFLEHSLAISNRELDTVLKVGPGMLLTLVEMEPPTVGQQVALWPGLFMET